ncbi:3-hydroxyacyl-CoA dehydrogenase/enoyl-CoA hydratase family protein [Paenibacillus thermoaerophilus]|uniref:3-hydroxyacyl-CoA dehydrogenase/enoyl-CoA hydratase family protein n=1 Tax=Paenibacillus thermoaerophilus TaxID=1215385 RepID=A0ABW2V828_9BACL|nr:3-hydroxyacyl-CoA dehydrogenase/enoyl-CoA hydratase family protein [Paenibacillus thermoaerophilus]
MNALNLTNVTVLGAGVMGAGIAAHLANCGLTVTLLDRLPDGTETGGADRGSRSKLAEEAVKRLHESNPAALFVPEAARRIRPGNFADDLEEAVSGADWVIEAVVERLEIKRQLMAQVAPLLKKDAILTTNTSGLSVQAIAEALPDEVRSRFFGTHFFNPPRYMKLLELIPAAATDADTLCAFAAFAERRLGKGTVAAKDTPNFIANRIGTYGLMVALAEMERFGLSVEAVDALTGTAIGRPKSATFRTLDLVGLDTFLHVIANQYNRSADEAERSIFAAPPLLTRLAEAGRLGEKTGAGFYRAERLPGGGKEIRQLDPATFGYVPLSPEGIRFPCLTAAKAARKPADKLAAMIQGRDDGSRFVWQLVKRLFLYAAERAFEIADDVASVDKAMKWGFNWTWGPFEMWDLLGFENICRRIEAEGDSLPEWVAAIRSEGASGFYRREGDSTSWRAADGWRLPAEPEPLTETEARKRCRALRGNASATLVDLGDEVAGLLLHAPSDAVGPDALDMIRRAVAETERNYRGLVLAGTGRHFCVGANLMLMLNEAEDENWDGIDKMIREFQQVGMAIKYASRPVVSAPYGMTLGGGVELAMPAARVQASAETYMGLVETGVGLIPAGGGTKELLVRFVQAADFDGKVDLQPQVNRAFELIGMARTSTSAAHAAKLGYLRASDGVTLNRDRLLADAKRAVLALDSLDYRPPVPVPVRTVGTPGFAVLQLGLYQLQEAGKISAYDAHIGRKLARVLSGGDVPAGTLVSEQHLLDLEREAFLSLLGEPKTQARMQHMLRTRKPLRN